MAEIKIRELSIGDWVMNLYANKPSRVRGLRTMFQDTYEIIAVSDDTQYMLIEDNKELHNFEPIPLTPEILEKNGFVDYEVGKGWYVLNVADDLRVWLHRNSHDWTFQLMKWSPLSTHEIGKVFIKHTHQLQHALRLAGVEKEIEL